MSHTKFCDQWLNFFGNKKIQIIINRMNIKPYLLEIYIIY